MSGCPDRHIRDYTLSIPSDILIAPGSILLQENIHIKTTLWGGLFLARMPGQALSGLYPVS